MSDMFYQLEYNSDILLPDNLMELATLIPRSVQLKNVYGVWKLIAGLMRKFD